MNRADQRLTAALLMLGDQLPPIIDEILAGQLDTDERRAFALVLCTIAADLDPAICMTETVTLLPGDDRTSDGERLRPAGPRPLPFSNSGP